MPDIFHDNVFKFPLMVFLSQNKEWFRLFRVKKFNPRTEQNLTRMLIFMQIFGYPFKTRKRERQICLSVFI